MIKTRLISNNFKIKSYSEQFPEIKIVSFEKRRDDRGYLLKTFTSQELQQEIDSLDEIYYSFSKKILLEVYTCKQNHTDYKISNLCKWINK